MKIYIGYDHEYPQPFKACVNSIFRNTYNPAYYSVLKLDQQVLRHSGIYTRKIDKKASTPFSLTRFLVPTLNGNKGWAAYCDCDFIFLEDVSELFSMRDSTKAIQVVQHPSYQVASITKMEGKQNYEYPKKNWSSLMLFNCEHEACKNLTADVVNSASPSFLHQFEWCEKKDIGQLPLPWNWLVGYYSSRSQASPKALHFTDGGPWLEEYKNVEYADKWYEYFN